jgi:hypothetical protein
MDFTDWTQAFPWATGLSPPEYRSAFFAVAVECEKQAEEGQRKICLLQKGKIHAGYRGVPMTQI